MWKNYPKQYRRQHVPAKEVGSYDATPDVVITYNKTIACLTKNLGTAGYMANKRMNSFVSRYIIHGNVDDDEISSVIPVLAAMLYIPRTGSAARTPLRTPMSK